MDFETLKWGNKYETAKSLRDIAEALERGKVAFVGGDVWEGSERQHASINFTADKPAEPVADVPYDIAAVWSFAGFKASLTHMSPYYSDLVVKSGGHNFMGVPVVVDEKVATGTVELRNGAGETIRRVNLR